MIKEIHESDMIFRFPEEVLFHIEQSEAYKHTQDHMRMSELIYYKKEEENQCIISLEAKKTAPNPNSEKVKNPKKKFQDYISEICEKFLNSLDLFFHMVLRNDSEIPSGFDDIQYERVRFLFVLVIKNQKKEWLGAVSETLNQELQSYIRVHNIWKAKVIVINEEIAIAKRLAVKS